ncbi:hypothetical protein LC612_00885 [Nostoc sp. CHAB 5834]|nr:hypothetical protein [Nostoc sp. CHAB 5834]
MNAEIYVSSYYCDCKSAIAPKQWGEIVSNYLLNFDISDRLLWIAA